MATLVTGGTGFIGSRLVAHLVERGETVHVLDVLSEVPRQLFNDRMRYFSGSIENCEDVRKAMSGCDKVYNLAAYAKNWAPDDQTFDDVNVQGTENVLAVAMSLDVKKVVHTSSNVALGPSNGVQVDECSSRHTDFYTPYERSKYLSEQTVQRYVKSGLCIVIVNPTRVFGPGPLNESNSVTKMIDWYLQGKWRLVPGNGSMIGNYVFVDDLIDGYVRAMQFGRPGERYILGGENISFNGFFDVLSDVSGHKYRMIHLPAWLAKSFALLEEFRSRHFNHYPMITPGWAKTFLCDWANSCAKAKKDLGYVITPLDKALRITADWLKHFDARRSVPL
jgi:nucleoside-diphosphate-sugar epimerase